MSYAVIYSNSDPANPADSADSTAAAIAITAFLLVPDLVDILLSLTLLTGVVLHSLNLGSSAHLPLVYISYSPSSFFYGEIALLFLTCLAILRILYRPVEK